jgi:hypothetical protein
VHRLRRLTTRQDALIAVAALAGGLVVLAAHGHTVWSDGWNPSFRLRLLQLSGAYGHALHARRPAARLADPPRPVPRTVPAIAALRAAGAEDERVYDDLVVVDEVGRCLGIVRVADLIRAMSR